MCNAVVEGLTAALDLGMHGEGKGDLTLESAPSPTGQ